MRSSIPTISSVSWTGFMTGQNPGKHGIYGFTDVKPGTLTTFFPNFGSVRSETLWDVAGRAGKRAIVMNVPNTYPARALNGLLVSGFVAVNLERAVYPAELLPRLQRHDYRIDVDYLNADQKPEAFFADLDATLEGRRRPRSGVAGVHPRPGPRLPPSRGAVPAGLRRTGGGRRAPRAHPRRPPRAARRLAGRACGRPSRAARVRARRALPRAVRRRGARPGRALRARLRPEGGAREGRDLRPERAHRDAHLGRLAL